MNQLVILIGRIPLILWVLVAGAWAYSIHTDFHEMQWNPILGQIVQQESTYKRLVKENSEAEAFKEQRAQKLKELNQLAQDFQSTADKIPRAPEVASVLRSLADISDNAGLTFARFKPGAQLQEEFLVITPLDVELKGTYPQILSFVDAAANIKRVVSGQELVMDSPSKRGGSAILQAKTVLYTYHIGDVVASDSASEEKEPKEGDK
ncbi:type 4a pilus biogenesis protein PilO [bacterium]|nr:type 4a pilus biogenesis protein PilO [bacterium]